MTEPGHVATALPKLEGMDRPRGAGRHLGAARRGQWLGRRHSSGCNLRWLVLPRRPLWDSAASVHVGSESGRDGPPAVMHRRRLRRY